MSGNGPSRLWKWLGGAALAAVVLSLVAAAFVAWVVPGMAKREASKGFEQATGRKLAIGDISIHPFTWNVEIRDLSMSEVGGKGTFASFKRAEARWGSPPCGGARPSSRRCAWRGRSSTSSEPAPTPTTSPTSSST